MRAILIGSMGKVAVLSQASAAVMATTDLCYGQSSGSVFTAISAGNNYTCGITA